MSRGHRRGAMRIDVSAIKEIFDHGHWPSAAAWFGCERLAVRLSSRAAARLFRHAHSSQGECRSECCYELLPESRGISGSASHDRAAELPPPERGICIILTGFSGLLPA